MPWKSKKQMRYFYAMKNKGEFSPQMVEKWKEHTPDIKNLPEQTEKKAMASGFWAGFEKKAAENYVAANSAMDVPGAPEKMLKWNELGGVDPRSPEELQSAGASQLVTLPKEVEGATCATCMHFRPLTEKLGHGFCTNPEIKMDVTQNMHCAHWQNPGSHDPVAAAQAEEEEMAAEQAAMAQQGMVPPGQEQGMGQAPGKAPGKAPSQPSAPNAGAIPEGAPQQGMDQAGAGAGAPSSMPETDSFKPSPVGRESGFPMGQQTSQNPMVEQAVQDFQGGGATAGPTGGDGGDANSAKPKAKPKKDSAKKDSGSSKGHTININVDKGSEKKASQSFWAGIVDGY